MLELTCGSKKEDNYSWNVLSMALIAQLQRTGHQQLVLNPYSVTMLRWCKILEIAAHMWGRVGLVEDLLVLPESESFGSQFQPWMKL